MMLTYTTKQIKDKHQLILGINLDFNLDISAQSSSCKIKKYLLILSMPRMILGQPLQE